MRAERARLSRHAPVARAMDTPLGRRDGCADLLTDGRVCLPNDAAGRAPRGVAPGRRARLFAGSDRGGERAALVRALIATARPGGVDPQVQRARVPARSAGTLRSRLGGRLPPSWAPRTGALDAARPMPSAAALP